MNCFVYCILFSVVYRVYRALNHVCYDLSPNTAIIRTSLEEVLIKERRERNIYVGWLGGHVRS